MHIDFRISPSQMNVLEACELRWALEHVDELREQYRAHDVVLVSRNRDRMVRPQFIFNAFGTVTHSMFDRFYRQNFRTPESFAGAWKGAWYRFMSENAIMFNSNSPGNTLADYSKRGAAMAARYFEENIDRRDRKPEIEKPYRLLVRTQNFSVMFIGRTDQVDREGGTPVITDFKTGKHRLTEEELRAGPQLPGYSFQYEQRHGEMPRIRVYFPGYGDVKTECVELEFSKEEHEKFVERLEKDGQRLADILERVRSGRRLGANYGYHCSYCPFSVSGECDAYTGQNKFAHKQIAMTLPSRLRSVRYVPHGQKHFHWPRKNVTLIREIEPAAERKADTPGLFDGA
jgi:hypothetical protein